MERPLSSWGDSGSLIEREHIDLVSDFGCWMARHGKPDDYSRADVSPPVTAMCAYLMREYGDEVPALAESRPVAAAGPARPVPGR